MMSAIEDAGKAVPMTPGLAKTVIIKVINYNSRHHSSHTRSSIFSRPYHNF